MIPTYQASHINTFNAVSDDLRTNLYQLHALKGVTKLKFIYCHYHDIAMPHINLMYTTV